MVSGVVNRIDRKLVVLDLGFLQAHHIRFVRGEPFEHDREAPADGVHVVGSDLHRDGMLGMLDYPACSGMTEDRKAVETRVPAIVFRTLPVSLRTHASVSGCYCS